MNDEESEKEKFRRGEGEGGDSTGLEIKVALGKLNNLLLLLLLLPPPLLPTGSWSSERAENRKLKSL